MKRWTALLLSLLMLFGLIIPAAAAEESADARLARVTELVKERLQLDTEVYTEFHGEVYEQPLGSVWSLYWSSETGSSLHVEAMEDGTIISYWRGDGDEIVTVNRARGLPAFPKVDAAAAKASAEAFLALVLDKKTESVVFGDDADEARLNSTSCRFSGGILVNGLPSPMGFWMNVRGSDNAVVSFSRDVPAQTYLGAIPSATPAVTKDAAAKTLRGTLTLELIYVSEDEGSRAVLRYVPKAQEDWMVDAQTGELVHPEGGMRTYGSNAAMDTAEEAMPAPMEMEKGLTEAELAGVEKLEGVLDREALDKLVRAEAAYKLGGWTLTAASYRLQKRGEEENVLCAMQYTQNSGDEEDYYTARRTFTVDARTGAVQSLWSGGRWDKDRVPAVKAEAAQRIAEAFLKTYSPNAGAFALYDSSDSVASGAPSYSFTFVRKVNGYFFPENACTIDVDCMDGAVCGLSYSYDEAKEFDGTAGLISEDAALDAWLASYETVLGYRLFAHELNASVPVEKKLLDSGMKSYPVLLLSYALERETWCAGVDAKTGEIVTYAESESGRITYSDVAGYWAAPEIETLAKYGVGYRGGKFAPDKTLTQWDFVCLLVSVRGWGLDPEKATPEERDSAYETAYYMGALTKDARNDEAVMTRGALVRMLLDCAGVGKVAQLPGIFTCAYSDAAEIPAGELGYAALAQAYGLVKDTAYASGTTATRAMAAVMLYRAMEREI